MAIAYHDRCRRDVKAQPATTVLHVFLKRSTLLRRVRLVVQPENEFITREIGDVEIVPVSGGSEFEVVALGGSSVVRNRLMSEVDVVALNRFRVEGQYMENR